MNLKDELNKTRFIPIAVFNDPPKALKMAELLTAGSINILEITLRTDAAYRCISEISKKFPDILLGCGSVLSRDALKKASDNGARFGVAPAFDPEIVDYASSINIPFIPGTATPTELYSAIKAGLKIIKVFPVSNLGGVDYLNAITAPFKIMDFHIVPTGGINEKNLPDYLKQERVIACGASYIVDSKLIEKGDFQELSERIKRLKVMIDSLK
ncbi:MAG: bifunctional 4-hydroxy-2-oxoglutarate aldolase/2-dehydro-3-deoxy-phosphogluconate aldolase [Spirochaetes bacterium]|jgi:2-dehydro-3-deoxyphosphogluconate aldolase/(4S)-4-hydroxy-2-oxoglutarate aldolase|nr:bifunctional 4-hydroxy-2-oxoglutarate aldolase/2-dehydro-3-deoxy-phosphogluconate aldolase [Spirochaetota bacterium]